VMNGKEKVVVISPDQFSQRKFSNALGTLGEDILNDLEEISLEIRVSGPKDGKITLFITETYEGGPTMPPRPSGW